MPTATPSLRERKRDRTRSRLLTSAADLFERHGYDGTTVADIAAAAEVGARTFFNYFGSKEELLFPHRETRAQAAIDAIESRTADEGPAEVLTRALFELDADAGPADPLEDRIARLQARFVEAVPAVRGRGLQIQFETQRKIAQHLHSAFSDDLDPLLAGALVGAFVGAFGGAAQGLADSPDAAGTNEFEAIRTAALAALGQWSHATARRTSPKAGSGG